MSLRDILKDLSAKHSYIDLHKELLGLMKEEYAALKDFFTEKQKRAPRKGQPQEQPQPQEQQQTQPQPQEQQQTQTQEPELPERQKLIANTKIRIIKTSPVPTVTVPELVPQEKLNSKDLKAWQKEQEAKKLAELTAGGIVPESLLTAENIKRWIEVEHRTFAYVAREYVGMPEAKVADFAKEHGVKSTISKKRAILSAKKGKLNASQ
jgi:hypothetical protein